jgi:hypothetical protein
MTQKVITYRTVSTMVYVGGSKRNGYGKRWYVGANISKKIRHESSVSVFEWRSSGKNRGRNRDLTEGQGEGSDPLSSCVESVEENKGREIKPEDPAEAACTLAAEPSLAALSLPFPRYPDRLNRDFLFTAAMAPTDSCYCNTARR